MAILGWRIPDYNGRCARAARIRPPSACAARHAAWRRDAVRRSRLLEAQLLLSHGDVAAVAEDDVVEHIDLQQAAGLDQRGGERHVVGAGRGVTAIRTPSPSSVSRRPNSKAAAMVVAFAEPSPCAAASVARSSPARLRSPSRSCSSLEASWSTSSRRAAGAEQDRQQLRCGERLRPQPLQPLARAFFGREFADPGAVGSLFPVGHRGGGGGTGEGRRSGSRSRRRSSSRKVTSTLVCGQWTTSTVSSASSSEKATGCTSNTRPSTSR